MHNKKNKHYPNLKVKCKRCGKCCVVYNFKKELWEDCKFLGKRNDDTTFCYIYRYRLGKHLGFFTICIKRKDSEYDYPNCPYNNGKDIHPAYKKS